MIFELQHLKRSGRRCRALAQGFATDRRGSIALKFAILGPAVALIAAGGIDVAAVKSADSRLQDLADASALAGAAELSLAIDDKSAVARATSFVDAGIKEWRDAPKVTSAVRVTNRDGQRVLEVRLSANRPSFFANLLPPGGWNFSALAQGTSLAQTPLCVIGSGTSGSGIIRVKDTGKLQAPACLIHSNRDIVVEGGNINAAAVQAVTSARGSIFPVAGTGAAQIDDPFAALSLDEKQPCTSGKSTEVEKTRRISVPPGVHCGGFKMHGTSTLILQPGEHWFLGGHLEIKENARLEGRDVTLMFDKKSKFDFKDQARVNLDGREDGPWAGMVMIATRGNTQDFIISADNVETLLGVIYVPQARLIVEGKSAVAKDSAWTVVVAQEIELKGSASLYINANYSASSVPVPSGVGPSGGVTRLIN